MKKKISIKVMAILFCVTMIVTLSACKKDGTSIKSPGGEVSSQTQSKIETPEVYTNPLTGLEGFNKDAIGKRPVGVMINNIKVSLPQKGLTAADIIYELPVEGGITRMLAVFADPLSIPQIGSIRSARHDFVELAMLHNAIYIHFGGSSYAYEKLASTKWNDIDGMSYIKCFEQDPSRIGKMGKEHTYFTNANLINATIAKKGFETKSKDGNQSDFFKFNKKEYAFDEFTECKKATINFSGYTVSVFDYDAATNKYKKSEYGAPHMDDNIKAQVSVDNVFILQTPVVLIDKIHKDVELKKGTGFYITNGKKIKITFEKQGDINGGFKFKDSQGKELSVKPGNSWVSFVPTESEVTLA